MRGPSQKKKLILWKNVAKPTHDTGYKTELVDSTLSRRHTYTPNVTSMLPLTAEALVQDRDLAAVLTSFQPQFAFVAVGYSVRATDRIELSRTHRTLALRPIPSLNALRAVVAHMGAARPHAICGNTEK